MKFPGIEKAVPAFSQLCLAIALLASPLTVRAGQVEDYQTGLAAYQAGDVTGAMDPLKRAADGGHAQAQALYGLLLDSADFDADAAIYLRQAADQGDADGQYGLAKMYLQLEAKAPDEAEINRLMRSAAAKGHAGATVAIALAYLRRDARLGAADPKDPDAAKFLLRAGELGDRTSLEELVHAYRTGAYGLPVDAAQADHWASRLAKLVGPKKGAKK